MSSPVFATDPIDAADIALLADGALKVREAREYSGLSRQQLFSLMGDGTLPWFTLNERGDRAIPKRALNEYLARLYAAHKQTTGAASRA